VAEFYSKRVSLHGPRPSPSAQSRALTHQGQLFGAVRSASTDGRHIPTNSVWDSGWHHVEKRGEQGGAKAGFICNYDYRLPVAMHPCARLLGQSCRPPGPLA
jgi:hypothetical protein